MKNYTQRWLLLLFLITSMAFSTHAQYYLLENFEGGTMPTGWTEEIGSSNNGWTFNSDASSTYWTIPEHSVYAAINDDACNCDMASVRLISIPFDLSTAVSPDLIFEGYQRDGTTTVQVFDGTTWTDLYVVPLNGEWEEQIIDLSDYAGMSNVQIAFHYNDNGGWGYGWAIDNISVGEPPTCPSPLQVSSINIFQTTATMVWLSDGSESNWNVEYGAQDFEQGNGTMEALTDTFFNVTGLNATTTYSYFVQADCGSEQSLWKGPYSFTTACAAISELPYVETFNSENLTEDCWTIINQNDDNNQWDLNYQYNTFEGDQVASIYASSTVDDYLISPQITLTGNQRLKFHHRISSTWSPANFEVLISTTSNDAESFTDTLLENANYLNTSYEEKVIDLSAYSGDVFVAFRVPSGPYSRFYLDEIIFEEIPTCPKPTHLGIDNITPFTAEASWVTGGAEAWHIEYGVQDFEQGTGILVELTDTFYTIPDLIPETTYEYYVRDSCDVGDLSVWNGPITFTTGISCYPPTDLLVDNIDFTSATATWNSEDTETIWNIQYGPYNFELGTGIQEALTDTFFNMENLNATTEYDFYVQANCEGLDGLSVWEGPFSFTTLCEEIVDYPYTQDFDGPWGCWTVIDHDEDGTTWTPGNQWLPAHSGEFSAHGMGNQDDYLISPQLVVDEAMWIRWWVDRESTYQDNAYEVLLSTTTNDSAGLTTVLATYETIPVVWTEITIDLSEYAGDTVYIAFHQTNSTADNYGFGIDDFALEYMPTCFVPTNLNATNITGYDADILWSTGGASNWNIEYGEAGFELGAGTFYEVVDTFMNISGLTPVTDYEFYVQDSCGVDDESLWAGPFSFTTTVSCPAPYGIVTTEANAYDVTLSWNAAFADNWNIEFGDLGFTQGEGTFMEVLDTVYTITSLTPETSYHFYVQDSCGTDDESVWVGPYTFSTIATCPIPTDIMVVPTDTSAVISWVTGGASLWNIEFGEEGFTQGAGTFLELTENTYEMEDLLAETTYTFYVQDSCAADDASYWVGPITFTTLMLPLSNPTECNVGIASVDNNCIYIPILVENAMEGDVLREFHFLAEHSFDGDLDISLQSPDGTLIELSTDNGSSGINYGINDTTCTQFTNFKMNGQDGLIIDGDAPFVGAFIPEGSFNDFNTEENLNGIWILHFCDDANTDGGQFLHGELVFGDPLITDAEFTEYAIVGQDSSEIFPENDSIVIYMPQGTYDLSELIAEFVLSDSAAAEVWFTEQVSGLTVNNWSNGPINYTVIAEDLTERTWAVHIHVTQFTGSDFQAYEIYTQDSSNIDLENQTIQVYMPSGTDNLSGLVATFTASEGSTVLVGSVLQQSGSTTNNWESGSVEYVITAQDGSQDTWTVYVEVNLFTGTDILTYTIPGQLGGTEYDLDNHTIEIEMNESITNITDRVADFTISDGASAKVGSTPQVSGDTENDFSQGSVIYTLTSESGVSTDWTVDVSLYVGLEDIEDNPSLNIFPNPNKGIFTISFDPSFNETVKMEIVNTKGQMVANFEKVNSKVSQSINLSELANGIYYLKVFTENETFVKKVNILK